jgi:peptide/nickel transport system permease protein
MYKKAWRKHLTPNSASMPRFIVYRILQTIPTILFITLLSFLLIRIAPGGPVAMLADNPGLRLEDIEQIRHNFGLDQPWYIQYFHWLQQLVFHFDLGVSYFTQQPVLQMIIERLPATLELMICAMLLSGVSALLIGVTVAYRHGTWVDKLITFLSAGGLALPNFWIGIMALMIFSVFLGWLPTGGRVPLGEGGIMLHMRSLILPTCVLSLSYTASWSRYICANMVEILHEEYIRTARAKGLPERTILWRHALRNACIPFLTVIGSEVPTWFTGAIITETIFAWPGVGRLFYEGALYHDYPRIMGILVFVSCMVVVSNLIIDCVYKIIDPRI